MKNTVHITSGDIAGDAIAKSGVGGEVLVWHDILYDGPRKPGWPEADTLLARSKFLEQATGGGLEQAFVLKTLQDQYTRLKTVARQYRLILWFDACLFDQSMLCHILTCLRLLGREAAEFLCIDAFAGIEPFHGLGQMSPGQLASVYNQRQPLTDAQFDFAETVDRAFSHQDVSAFHRLAGEKNPPLPWIPAAVKRWLEEQPDPVSGLGRLEQMALAAVRAGCRSPWDIFAAVSQQETPPQYWGDTTLWAKINDLTDRNPPLVRIEGPADRLPQWEEMGDLTLFQVLPV